MGWIDRKMDESHMCWLPIAASAGVGSLYQCDECGQKWTIINSQGRNMFIKYVPYQGPYSTEMTQDR